MSMAMSYDKEELDERNLVHMTFTIRPAYAANQ